MSRSSLFLILLLSSCIPSIAQETTTLIFTRHAEKLDDGTRDPDLSKEGYERAQKIASLLEKVGLTAIYSTDYKRTRNTVKPIADQKELGITIYDPRDDKFIMEILNSEKGGTVLISGHSNTIPTMINQVAQTNYPNFSEEEYDNLIIVIIKPENEPQLIWLTIR